MSRVARAIGDPTRIKMLTLLMEGRALTAKELAYGAGVEPGTATTHLQRLVADALVTSAAQGRHKYFRLSSPEVATCLEALMVIARPRAGGERTELPPIRMARFCYDHLAGRVAIELTQALLAEGVLRRQENEFLISKTGERWFAKFGVDLAKVAESRRKHAYACLDWSERKDHIGGALGAALAQRMVSKGWIRRKKESRVATVTPEGRKQLHACFGIVCEECEAG